jgi:prepilin-type N-terminal cleavage/methylation domain-containing protein
MFYILMVIMRAKQKRHSGFTIVELLIVIVVIGILAAITIVSFNGIQNRASDTVIMADLKNFKTKVELSKATLGEYPAGLSASNMTVVGFKASKSAYATSPTTANNFWYCRNSTLDKWSLTVLSKSGGIFYVTESGSPTKYTGSKTWSSTLQNCDQIVSPDQGWQIAGYIASDTTTGPWQAWAGGN